MYFSGIQWSLQFTFTSLLSAQFSSVIILWIVVCYFLDLCCALDLQNWFIYQLQVCALKQHFANFPTPSSLVTTSNYTLCLMSLAFLDISDIIEFFSLSNVISLSIMPLKSIQVVTRSRIAKTFFLLFISKIVLPK